ncbi:polycystin 2 [Stylonychia lemnae]|uniref:Polycystin 2 n=1 Tax=Stylonychia lemnae TaxID=5949 RepID=A0A078AT94_STYLE|nr:polycystin 2 [Stylonychia lemnae]|eukprot:CDW84387.1 polycystin 2 [Stylonychia lemnae]
MILSKRKIKLLKLCLTSTALEKGLLLTYLALFPVMVFFASYNNPLNIENYDIRTNILKYYDQDQIIKARTYNDIYSYLDELLHERLWVKNKSSPYQPIGTLRLAQYRVQSDCTEKEIREECSTIECFKKMYSPSCNQLFVANQTEAKEFFPNNKSICQYRECGEYNYSNVQIRDFSGNFGTYGGGGFSIDFTYNKTQNKNQINELIKNSWLDLNTRAVCLSWSVHNVWSDRYFITTVFLENPGNSIFSVSFRVQTAYIYKKDDPDSYSDKVSVIVIYTLFLLNTLLFAGKTVLELGLSINRFTNLIEILNLTLCCLAVSGRIGSIGIVVDNIELENAYDSFQTFSTQASLHQFEIIALGTAALFYPFRAYQLFSHFNFFKPMCIFLNTIFRMFPGISTFFIITTTLFACWAQGFYLIFSPYLFEFRNYFESLLTISFKRFYENDQFAKFTQNRDFAYLEVAGLLMSWTTTLILIIFIAMVTTLYKKATGFEKGAEIMTLEKQQILNDIKDIKDKVNLIYIKKLKTFSGNSNLFLENMQIQKGRDESEVSMQMKNKKIVVWLINRSRRSMRAERESLFKKINEEIIEEYEFLQMVKTSDLNRRESVAVFKDPRKSSASFGGKMIRVESSENKNVSAGGVGVGVQYPNYINSHNQPHQIEFIDFEDFKQLKNFLDSFFKIKPALITSASFDKFRIVIENYVEQEHLQFQNSPDLEDIMMNNERNDYAYQKLKQSSEESNRKNDKISKQQKQLRKQQLHHAEEVIDYLKEIGSKVPVIIYSNYEEDQQGFKKIMKIKMKYQMLQTTNKIDDLKRFCMMQLHGGNQNNNQNQKLSSAHKQSIFQQQI